MATKVKTYTTLGGKKLQSFYAIEIAHVETGDGSYAEATFTSTIHTNRRITLSPSFSGDFSDSQILNDPDLINFVHKRFSTDIYSVI